MVFLWCYNHYFIFFPVRRNNRAQKISILFANIPLDILGVTLLRFQIILPKKVAFSGIILFRLDFISSRTMIVAAQQWKRFNVCKARKMARLHFVQHVLWKETIFHSN